MNTSTVIRKRKSLKNSSVLKVKIPIFRKDRGGLMRSLRVIVIMVLFQLLCFSGASAATITLSVVQNEDAPEIALQMSQTVEDQLFANYFDSGHIVSNSDISFDGSQFEKTSYGIKEAAFGLSDYLIVIYLHYGPQELQNVEKKTSFAELNTLSWRVMNVLTSKVIAEKSIDITKIKVLDADPYKQARILTDAISTETMKALNTKK